MVGAWCRNARGDHVAIADGLDLLEPIPLGEVVEVTEQVIEVADHLGGRETLRPGREVDDVGEQDRGRPELIRDRLGLGLQPVGDRARQDVEQKVLGLCLLDPERCERIAALAGEHREQREHDGAADRDVQGQHRAREPDGQRRPERADHLARESRTEEHDDERDVPAGRRPDAAEHERPERGENSPEADAAGVEEPAERDHRQRWREQDVELAHPEQPREVARAREHGYGAEQDGEVDERHHTDRRAECEIQRTPQRGDRQDQHRDQDQQRLAARRSSSSWGSAPTSARRAVMRSAAARIRSRKRIAKDVTCGAVDESAMSFPVAVGLSS